MFLTRITVSWNLIEGAATGGKVGGNECTRY